MAVHIDEPPIRTRQLVVDDDVLKDSSWKDQSYETYLPFAVSPELEVEDTGIVLGKRLVGRNDAVEELLTQGEVGHGGQEPAVSEGALFDGEAGLLSDDQLGVRHYLLNYRQY